MDIAGNRTFRISAERMNLLEQITCGLKQKDRTAIILPEIGEGAEISYEELERLVLDLCGSDALSSKRRGEPVCLLLENSLEYVIFFFALLRIGCPVNPLNPGYSPKEILFYLNDIKPSTIFVSSGDKQRLDSALEACSRYENRIELYVVGSSFEKEGLSIVTKLFRDIHHDNTKSQITLDPDICLIVHTSGTTGRQKGVPLSKFNITSSVKNIAHHYDLSCEDIAMCVMPLFHVHGLIGVLLSSLYAGSAVVLPTKFSVNNFWPLVLKFECTWYSAVPTIHSYLISKHDEIYPGNTGSLRFIRSCSSPLTSSVQKDQERLYNLPVLQAYAMSEASHQVTSIPLPNKGKSKCGSAGIPTGVDVAIIGLDGSHVPPCEQGEVCVRGPSVFSGNCYK